MRSMQYRKIDEQVVVETLVDGFVRNGYIEPILGRVQQMEVECFQERWCEQGTTETETLLFIVHLRLASLGIEVREVDFSVFIGGNGSSHATILPF